MAKLFLPAGFIPPEDFERSTDFDVRPALVTITRLRDKASLPVEITLGPWPTPDEFRAQFALAMGEQPDADEEVPL